MSSSNIARDNIIEQLTSRLFCAVSGDDSLGRPPLPAFVYDGRAFNARQWERSICQEDSEDAGVEKYKVCYDSPDKLLRLILRFKLYAEYPVLEWGVELAAIGKKDTSELEAFRSICLELPMTLDNSINVRGNYGCKDRLDDFQPRTFQLNGRYPDNSLHLDTDDFGAASAWLPYFNFDFDDANGFEIGIGWSGNWFLNSFLDEGSLSLEVGMKRFRLCLHPGETIVAPSIYILLRDGISIQEGQLLHRRFLNEFHTPKNSSGGTLLPLQSFGMQGTAGQSRLLKALDEIGKAGGTAVEITQGWNGKDSGGLVAMQVPIKENLGDWHPNGRLYPDGFAQISNAASQKGIALVLWMELFSAAPKSKIAMEHPDWFLAHFDADRELLLNLGLKPARDWAINVLATLVQTEGISHFILPLPNDLSIYWEHSEKKDRQGAVEASFIAGWRVFMDGVHAQFPGCILQSNASLFSDFEAISRITAHCAAGFTDSESGDFHQNNMPRLMHLAEVLPVFSGIGTVVPGAEGSIGACLCASASNLQFPAGYVPSDFANFDTIKRISLLFNRDFHLLHSGENSYAYQLHDFTSGDGALVALGNDANMELELNQIDTRAKYVVEMFPDFKPTEMKGNAFEKLTPKISNYENGFVMFYSRARAKK